jgi:hypothetical protein
MPNSLAVWRPSLWTSHTPPRAFGKVGLGSEHLLADGLGRKNAPRAFTAKVIALGGDVEQFAS